MAQLVKCLLPKREDRVQAPSTRVKARCSSTQLTPQFWVEEAMSVDKRTPGAHWPARLAQLRHSGISELSISKGKVGSDGGREIADMETQSPHVQTHGHIPTQTYNAHIKDKIIVLLR